MHALIIGMPRPLGRPSWCIDIDVNIGMMQTVLRERQREVPVEFAQCTVYSVECTCKNWTEVKLSRVIGLHGETFVDTAREIDLHGETFVDTVSCVV